VGTVKFTSSDSSASLPVNYTFKTSDHGVHTFSAAFNTVGAQSLTATDTATSSITGTQTGIVVQAMAPLVVMGGSSSRVAQGTLSTITIAGPVPTTRSADGKTARPGDELFRNWPASSEEGTVVIGLHKAAETMEQWAAALVGSLEVG
jgi:hypothetical protein